MHAAFSKIALGVFIFATLNVTAGTVRYVNIGNAGSATPFTSWETAATNIQDAIDVSAAGDTIWVTNGVYETGGKVVYGSISNRVALSEGVLVRSLNGPLATFIIGGQGIGGGNGDGACRCAYVGSNATLIGFTLTNGYTSTNGGYLEQRGGGVWSEIDGTVSNCVFINNSASEAGGGIYSGHAYNCKFTGNSAGRAGGAYHTLLDNCILSNNAATDPLIGIGGGSGYGTLNNCIVVNNSAATLGGGVEYGNLTNCILIGNVANYGGGVDNASLYNCTVISNSAATYGGGTYNCNLNNCIVFYNDAPANPNYRSGTVNYSCTTPMPTRGSGNITNEPGFIGLFDNLRLQSNSPCINTGSNGCVSSLVDLDGRPRVVGGTVDMGAYEYQGPGIGEFTQWLSRFSLPTDGSADSVDSDGDGLNNWQEWRCATDPINALSALRLLSPQSDGNNIIVRWQSAINVNYFLERASSMGATNMFQAVADALPGQTGITTYTDTNAAVIAPVFYRVGVR